MTMTNIPYYNCNKIFFEPGYIPISITGYGFNLFGSRRNSIIRLSKAIWFGSLTADKKAGHITGLSKTIDVLTPAEMLGNLFILSLFHRCCTVLVSSGKLYIDNSNMKPIYKYAASFALSAIPSLFLILFMGYPPSELILNACITQAASSGISYFSLQAGNYLRSLDLISDTKEVKKKEYISRVLISSAIDIALTFIWHGPALYKDPFKLSDSYNTIQYCIERSDKQEKMISIINLSISLISIVDKFIWLAGRMAFDGMLYKAHQLNLIKDIRSPFIKFNVAKDNLASVIKKYQTKQSQYNSNIRKSRTAHQSKKLDIDVVERDSYTETYQITTPSSISKKDLPTEKFKPKTRKAVTNITREIEERATPIATSITVDNITFYKIDGPNINYSNTWGVISLKGRYEGMSLYKTSLSSGHVGNQHSAIKQLEKGVYEIRPKSADSRLLGKMQVGIEGLSRVLLLGQAMDLYEKLKTQGDNIEPNLIIFDSWAKKHKDIAKTIARM